MQSPLRVPSRFSTLATALVALVAILLLGVAASPAQAAPSQCGVLLPGEQLLPGESVSSCSDNSFLVHQTDGNVVTYRDGVARWNTQTAGQATSTFVMQGDGNLVLYAADGRPLWDSRTAGNPGAYATVRVGFIIMFQANGSGLKLIPSPYDRTGLIP